MCSQLGLDMDVIDSSATYSKNQERYQVSKAAPVGFPDLVGSNQEGFAIFIELKAPGKLKTLRPAQRQFLLRKAQAGCFAAVVDSAELLFDLYCLWKQSGSSALLTLLANPQE